MSGQIKREVSTVHNRSIPIIYSLFQSRFAVYTEINFEQVNGSSGYNQVGAFLYDCAQQLYNDCLQVNLNNGSVNLALAEGVMHDVFVSSIVGGGE